MNMITAVFLLYMSEEEAFWLLVTLVEGILKGYYTKEMMGSCIDQRVFEVRIVSLSLSPYVVQICTSYRLQDHRENLLYLALCLLNFTGL